jgi:hypothetical protein
VRRERRATSDDPAINAAHGCRVHPIAMRVASSTLALLLAVAVAQPVSARLRYFGYHGGGDDDAGLARTAGYTNFAYVVAPADPASPFVRERVLAMARQRVQAVIELGPLLWCDAEGDRTFEALCPDWAARWGVWKAANAGALSSPRVLGFAVLDEPFLSGVPMADYEAAAAKVKADFPWATLLLVEAACAVLGQCGATPQPSFGAYGGTLPGVDWIGLDAYAIHPATNAGYRAALAALRSRFPDRQRIYVLDGFWTPGHAAVARRPAAMRVIAREWYEVARADPGAVLLGVFAWGPYPPGTTTSRQLPCSVLAEHAAIGGAITRKRGGGPCTLRGVVARVEPE